MSFFAWIRGMREALIKIKHGQVSKEEMIAFASEALAGVDRCVRPSLDDELLNEVQDRAEKNWREALNAARDRPLDAPISAAVAAFSALEVVERKVFEE